MRPIDADALMDDIKRDSKKAIDDGDKVGSFWLGYAAGLVIKQPTIQPEKAQLFKEGTTKDAISRQAAIDIGRNATVDTNPSHFEAHQKFTQFMDDAEVSSFGRWQWANGFNTALTAVGIDLKKLPTVQPEPPWIPVSERLPRDMQYVLLTVRRLNNAYNPRPFISVGYIGWNQHHWWCAHDGDCEISKVEVLAWMPLPKPFEGGIK